MDFSTIFNEDDFDLISKQDIDNLNVLSSGLDYFSNVIFRTNLFTNQKSYIFSYNGSPIFLSSLKKPNNKLFDRIYNYLVEFAEDNLEDPSREIIFFDHTIIEKTGKEVEVIKEELPKVRGEILDFFDSYYGCDKKRFLDCLSSFDNPTITQLEGIIIDHKREQNSLLTFQIYPKLEEFETNSNLKLDLIKKSIINLSTLHNIDINFSVNTITKLQEITTTSDIRLNYKIDYSQSNQSNTFELLFLPRNRETFKNAIEQTLINFKSIGVLSDSQIDSLRKWQRKNNSLVSHLGLEFSEKTIQPIGYYGRMFNEVIDRPSSIVNKIEY
jgi:hypothetical protein